MHLVILVVVVAIAWLSRSIKVSQASWDQCLFRFLFAPLLVLSNAVALINMGTDGTMLGKPLGLWSMVSFAIASIFLGYALGIWLYRAYNAWRNLKEVQALPQVQWQGETAYLLATQELIAARVGLWDSQLVISQGLLDQMSQAHASAIQHHELAHWHYRDTFWFFWLGWLRQITQWLPQSQALWQELLLLRELRADSWASQHSDALILAEALYLMASSHSRWQSEFVAGASDRLDRLEVRINHLLEPITDSPSPSMIWRCALAILPLLTIFLHSGL